MGRKIGFNWVISIIQLVGVIQILGIQDGGIRREILYGGTAFYGNRRKRRFIKRMDGCIQSQNSKRRRKKKMKIKKRYFYKL